MTTTDRVAGLNGSVGFKAPCRAATTVAITLSGEQTIDGVAIVSGDRVLVKNQSTTSANGIYNASTGSWSRALDFDGSRDAVNGTLVYVTNGTTNGNNIFQLTATDPVTVGTTSLAFSAVDVSGTAITLTAGTGLTGGGVLDANRTISLGTIADDRVLANVSGSTAAPSATTLTALIDACIGSTQGQILYRSAASWLALAAGTSGYVLTANGAGADPAWQATGAATSIPSGAVCAFAMNSAPTGWLKCDGSAVSRATYSNLFAAIYKSATATITIASPGVVSWTSHGLSIGDKVRFTTSGALPTGLSTGTDYFIISSGFGANSFQLASTAGGSAINTSGSQSGTHTAISAPYGIGDGSTTFNVPDLRGEWVRGWDDAKGTDANRSRGSSQAEMIGPHNHTAGSSGSTSSDGAHTHTINVYDGSGGSLAPQTTTTAGGIVATPTTSSNGAHTHTLTISTTVSNNSGTENRVRNIALLYCIKT